MNVAGILIRGEVSAPASSAFNAAFSMSLRFAILISSTCLCEYQHGTGLVRFLCVALSGLRRFFVSIPRALPWAVLFSPLWGWLIFRVGQGRPCRVIARVSQIQIKRMATIHLGVASVAATQISIQWIVSSIQISAWAKAHPTDYWA